MEQYLYTEFSSFLSKYFKGKIQKLSVDAGFSCPNRDGTIGRGGCTYCNNRTFNPDYCASRLSVANQLLEGKLFFSKKYPQMRYLAYFQAYTNTYGDLKQLKDLYEEALSVDGVVGLVIGTRPDCVSDELLCYLSDLHNKSFVLMEYGVETTDNLTLQRINRGHSYESAVQTIYRTAGYGIPVGIHLIMGLPGESRICMRDRAFEISKLPIDTLKLHQLQLVKGTKMAHDYELNPNDFAFFTPEEYADFVSEFLVRLDKRIAVERFTSQSPKDLLIAPEWGLKNYQFVELVKKKLRENHCWQGKWYDDLGKSCF